MIITFCFVFRTKSFFALKLLSLHLCLFSLLLTQVLLYQKSPHHNPFQEEKEYMLSSFIPRRKSIYVVQFYSKKKKNICCPVLFQEEKVYMLSSFIPRRKRIYVVQFYSKNKKYICCPVLFQEEKVFLLSSFIWIFVSFSIVSCLSWDIFCYL